MVRKGRYRKLLEPYHIGGVQTRNRIIKTVVTTRYWDGCGWEVNDKIKAYYEATARGGAGLIMVECPTIDYPGSSIRLDRYRVDDDRCLKGLSELTQVIHKHGCPAFIQVYHCGPWAKQSVIGVQPVAASSVTFESEFDSHNEMPRELSIPEIQGLVDKFASAAERIRKAGFDGIEINAGSSHLIATFISRFWNKRRDIYGCHGMENRSRFLVEIIQEIKKRAGAAFPVVVLINAIETGGGELGMTIEESQELARLIEKAGADALQVRSHWIGYHIGSFQNEVLFYPEPQVPLALFPKELDWSRRGVGANAPAAAVIKRTVSIPVITSGRFTPELGEDVLRKGKADFIGMCRRLVADVDLPRKLSEGKPDAIRPCTSCGECLVPREGGLRCRVNAAMGTEDQFVVRRADRKKTVMVVGGGPAGMEAARVAAMRGHEVVIVDKATKLGGLLPLASLVKGLEIEDLPALVSYFKKQIINLGVKIRLGREAGPSMVEEMRPDVVILAQGGVPEVPQIPGIDRPNVISNEALHKSLKVYLRFFGPRFLRWLTKFWMPLGKRVTVIGGSIHGCELAEFLVKRGRKVTIVDAAGELGEGMSMERKARLMLWFSKKGVRMLTGVKYEEITDKGLVIVDDTGRRQTLEADNIVPALPFKPNTELLKGLEGKVPEIYAIGDCRSPGLILDAIADGSRIAHSI